MSLFCPHPAKYFLRSRYLWARKQLAYKYDGNKILFVIIFFNAITCTKEEGKQTLPGCTKVP